MHATIQQALGWMATETGKHVVRDRAALLNHINDARRLLYSLYNKAKIAIFIEGCFKACEFYDPCRDCNCEPMSYCGITLPDDMLQAEMIMKDGRRVDIHNSWADYSSTHTCEGSCIKSIDMGGDFPTQLDLNPKRCVHPVMMAIDPADCGKMARLNFIDETFAERSETIQLTQAGSATEASARQFMKPGGVVLPPDLVGGVIMYDCADGTQIGYYKRGITVPGFRRIKLLNICCGDTVFVRGTRRYVDLAFDWEIMETDNKLVLLEAYRYNKVAAVNSSDAQWIAMARFHMANLIEWIGGDNLRDDGAGTVKRFQFGSAPKSHRRRLNHSRR